ncbi:hypothetical protein HanRHA438_Chr14g0635061 [Helianthus annuus]|nr:hypothetical protein HanOQP8_Chr14g0510881 [Helianthus annuus]KAJ0852169.1 hypothetical protein HanRHA438_Chr14g0635061 [Helianthus annuus]
MLCRLCGDYDEDADHLCISCGSTPMVWQKVSSWCKVPQFFAFTMKYLFETHRYMGISGDKRKLAQTVILATCWIIRKAQNEFSFSGKRVSRAKRHNLEWRDWVMFDIPV